MEAQIDLQEILDEGGDALAQFLAATPLACCDDEQTVLAAILPSHPELNARPEPGGEIGYVLKVAQDFSELWFHLPATLEYRALRITTGDPVVHFEIDTATGTVRTNMQELGRKMMEWSARTEDERLAAFATLAGESKVSAPASEGEAEAFTSKTLGTVTPDEYGDIWEAEKIAIPYFDGKLVNVELFDISAGDAADIDAAMENFLSLTTKDRAAAAPLVLANCREFLEAVGVETEEDREMVTMTDASGIWRFVDCVSLSIKRNSCQGEPSSYIALICNCACEREHGLQIVYRNGETLGRVSAQDGSVV